jgi:hypothetical protein
MITPFREVKDGVLRFNFHPGQTKAWDCKKRFLFLLAGTQGGKTCFGPPWMDREIQRRGEGDYLAVTATFPLLNLKMLPEYIEHFQHIRKLGEFKEMRGTKVIQWYKGKTRIIFASATNPESVESATAKAAHLDEPGQNQFKREAWEAVLRRLSIEQGPVLGTTTLYGYGWFKTEVYDRWKNGDPDIEVIQFESTINPAFPQKEYERARMALPSWKFDLFYRGQYAKPAGMIYDSFDEMCKIPRMPIPIQWPRYVGLDFGGINTAALWYAQDPATGYLYLYREYKKGQKSAGEHAQDFKALSQGETIIKRVGGAKSEDQWRMEFSQSGWPVQTPRINDVEVGIDRVYALHKSNKIFVFSDMIGYLDEKMSYSRELDDNYSPTEKIENKERFHYMDAERYILGDFTPELATASTQKPVQTRLTSSRRI